MFLLTSTCQWVQNFVHFYKKIRELAMPYLPSHAEQNTKLKV